MISKETFKTRIEAPKRITGGVYLQYLHEFMQTDDMSMKLNCSSVEEAERVYSSLMSGRKRHNYNVTVWKKNCCVIATKG